MQAGPAHRVREARPEQPTVKGNKQMNNTDPAEPDLAELLDQYEKLQNNTTQYTPRSTHDLTNSYVNLHHLYTHAAQTNNPTDQAKHLQRINEIDNEFKRRDDMLTIATNITTLIRAKTARLKQEIAKLEWRDYQKFLDTTKADPVNE